MNIIEVIKYFNTFILIIWKLSTLLICIVEDDTEIEKMCLNLNQLLQLCVIKIMLTVTLTVSYQMKDLSNNIKVPLNVVSMYKTSV